MIPVPPRQDCEAMVSTHHGSTNAVLLLVIISESFEDHAKPSLLEQAAHDLAACLHHAGTETRSSSTKAELCARLHSLSQRARHRSVHCRGSVREPGHLEGRQRCGATCTRVACAAQKCRAHTSAWRGGLKSPRQQLRHAAPRQMLRLPSRNAAARAERRRTAAQRAGDRVP